MTEGKRRKARSDRNHVVYRLVCIPTGERYIGVTVVTGRAYLRSIEQRWQQHLYSAFTQQLTGALQVCIRQNGADAFRRELVCIVRGKAAAHACERGLIASEQPELNIECTSRKRVRGLEVSV